MSEFATLLDELEAFAVARKNVAQALRAVGAFNSAACEEVEAHMASNAASAIRALEAQSKDKEAGE